MNLCYDFYPSFPLFPLLKFSIKIAHDHIVMSLPFRWNLLNIVKLISILLAVAGRWGAYTWFCLSLYLSFDANVINAMGSFTFKNMTKLFT